MSSQTATEGEESRQSTTPLSFRDIHNTNINASPGVTLTDHARLLVGSILDLYEGKGSLKHLSLWSPQAYHTNPGGIIKGHRENVAAWYAHATWCESIQIQSHLVTSGGNPIRFNLSNKYLFRGIRMELIIDSEVWVHADKDGKVERLEERWVTVTNAGGRPAQSVEGQSAWSLLGWISTRISEWCWWTVCTSTYWWAAWPLRRATGLLATECMRAIKDVEDWEFESTGEHKKNA
ncbi:hypothetical protein ACJZ2D_012306 [Fusarium nematophilum]